jgi:23S rRNA pseudouridine1911/1915/1917 synthase
MPPVGQNFHVLPQQASLTLAAALRRWMPGKSWSELERLVRKRHVLVNGNLCLDAGRRLKPGEVVKILEHPTAPLPRDEDVRVRYLDQHLVIVEKPAGVTSNRHDAEQNWPARRKQIQPTLDEMLPSIIDRIHQGGSKRPKGQPPGKRGRPVPVRPVHRLDRETSGLMVFARTAAAERLLGERFRQHTIERRYLAIVHGKIESQTIETNLVRDRGDGRRGSTTAPNTGKRAVTHVLPLEDLGDYTLVECQLETGRTHQIRIHLAELGHPLCGEKVYHQPLFGKPRPDKSGAPRIALHAAELGLDHPITGEHLHFKMPLPPDLADFLARLRKQKMSAKREDGRP